VLVQSLRRILVLLVLTFVLGKVLSAGSKVPVKASRANPIGAFAPLPFDPYDCHRAYSDPELCLKDPFTPRPIIFPYWSVNETATGFVKYNPCNPLKNETQCLQVAGKKNGSGLFDFYSLYPIIYPVRKSCLSSFTVVYHLLGCNTSSEL